MSETINQSKAFEALRARLGGELRPVRPFLPGRWMVLFLALFVSVCLIYLGLRFGWRVDSDTLGVPWVWGLSALELAAAAVLLLHVLREAVPGRGSNLAILGFGAAGAAILHAAVAMATWTRSPMAPAPGEEWRAGAYCFSYEVALGIPCVLFAVWLGRRGLTARPRRLGVLGGVGAGLAADALWRLVCPYSSPGHAFGSHSLGILAVVGLGLLLTTWWESVRLRDWRTRESTSI